VAAQVPVCDPFTVNASAAGDQLYPDAAVGPNGRFVATWMSSDQDGDGWGIYARWFTATCQPLTADVQVNTVTHDNQYYPRIDPDGQGRFVIAWVDSPRGVFVRRFDNNGTALGGELDVAGTGLAYKASVSANGSGSFVVAHLISGSPDLTVAARRFGSDGLPVGDTIIVATFPFPSWGEETAVELREDGSFLVVWGDGEEVFSRRYGPDDIPLGDGVQLSQLAPQSINSYHLDAGSEVGGRYRVFWATDINLEELTTMTRTVSATGTLGALTDLTTPTNAVPGYSMTSRGDFVVTDYTEFGDLSGTIFAGDHTVLGNFVVAPGPRSHLCGSALSHQGPDPKELTAVWVEPVPDGSHRDVRARLFSGRIFADGFESGDTRAWSVVVP
jgi:hypothetical protein